MMPFKLFVAGFDFMGRKFCLDFPFGHNNPPRAHMRWIVFVAIKKTMIGTFIALKPNGHLPTHFVRLNNPNIGVLLLPYNLAHNGGIRQDWRRLLFDTRGNIPSHNNRLAYKITREGAI